MQSSWARGIFHGQCNGIMVKYIGVYNVVFVLSQGRKEQWKWEKSTLHPI